MITIYALIDPRDNQIRYVGKTKDVNKRIKEHLKLREKTYKNNWLKNLIYNGYKPIMNILEIVNNNNWKNKERYYIKHYRDLGCKLTNMTDGGEGITFTDVIKNKISIANKGRKHTKESRINMSIGQSGKKLSKSHKLKISNKLRGIKRSNDFCDKQRQRMLGKKWSEKSRIKLSKSRKGFIWKEESKNKLKKPILQFDKECNFIKKFDGLTDASNIFNGSPSNIWRCLNKQRKTAYGYKWEYIKEMHND